MTFHESVRIADYLPAYFGDRRGLVVLMSAFFDESENGPYFSVGGYLFRKSKVRPFEREWGRMLKRFELPYFRMSACNAGQAPFKHLSAAECDLAAREAIRIVSKYASYGHYVVVRPTEFYEVMTKDSFAANPYTLAAYFCIMCMGFWADDNDPNALMGYFFEAGSDHQSDAEQVIRQIGLDERRSARFRYSGHGFVFKERSMPTQAADMLAWHATKNFTRGDAGQQSLRGDFIALLDGVPTKHLLMTRERLRQSSDIVNRTANGRIAKAAFRVGGDTPMGTLREIMRGIEENR